jgi:ankyrin repeat protein
VKYAGYAALHQAVQRPKLDLAGLLLDRGADIEVRNTEHGNTPLLLLTKSNSGEMSKTEVANALWLIERGADVNARNEEGATPLHHAADANSLVIIDALVAKRAQVTLSTYGQTPLFYCLSTNFSNTAIWDRLIALGCDVNHVDERKDTPLLRAQSSWNVKAVAYLLTRGADPSHRNAEGETALESATALNQEKIIKVLGSTKSTKVAPVEGRAAAPTTASKATKKPATNKPAKSQRG